MKIGFIGTGKITQAVVKGLCTSKIENLTIALSPRNETLSRALADEFDCVQRMASNQAVLDHVDIVCVAVRPSDAIAILSDLAFRPDHTVVSFVSTLTCPELNQAVAPASQACRAIPLPSVMYHQCPIPVSPAIDSVMDLFAFIGQPLPVHRESDLHALCTLTGLISPYYDLLGELSQWAVEHGVQSDTANQFTADLFHALAFAAQQATPIDFQALAHHAATPKGMNEQAARDIRQQDAHSAYTQACDTLLKRFPSLD